MGFNSNLKTGTKTGGRPTRLVFSFEALRILMRNSLLEFQAKVRGSDNTLEPLNYLIFLEPGVERIERK